MIRIESENEILMKHGKLKFSFLLSDSVITELSGENGVGKSTFIQYLKLNQKKYFENKSIAFLDQFPIVPLGKLSLKDLISLLDEDLNRGKLFCEKLLDLFEFRDFYDSPIVNLSGGQNQMVKIISTFYQEKDIYILDEPANCLDKKRIKILEGLILNELKKKKYILYVNHFREFLNGINVNNIVMIQNGDLYEIK